MKSTTFFSIKALSPISHGSFANGKDTGNLMEFRQMEVVNNDGEIVSIPTISGNSIRGVMRRALTREYLKKLGFRSDRLYFLMANGGALSKSLDSYIRPERVAHVRRLFPILSAFGSAMYTYMLPGQVDMSFAMLQCEELGTGLISAGSLLTEISGSRHLERAECDYPEGAKPMPFVVECVMQGSIFDCSFSFLDSATELDLATVHHGLNLITNLGGKHAEGFGHVELSQKFEDQPYLDWLAGIDDPYREEVKAWEKELVASMK